VFYWAGVDRFMMYNGVVRDVPNQFNFNYFFDGINLQQRQKVFAYKVPKYGEIWWCYPRGTATECTHAVVFNVREGYWFDTQLPDQGRTDGLYAKVYFLPFMMGAEQTIDGYDLWQHETGADRERIGDVQPVPAHFETAEISLVDADEKPESAALGVGIVEPDFVQSGTLTMTVRGRANAKSQEREILPVDILESPATPAETIVRVKTERRLLSFRFDTNTVGGDFQAGDTVAHVRKTDQKVTE